jgi:hypothetical protein
MANDMPGRYERRGMSLWAKGCLAAVAVAAAGLVLARMGVLDGGGLPADWLGRWWNQGRAGNAAATGDWAGLWLADAERLPLLELSESRRGGLAGRLIVEGGRFDDVSESVKELSGNGAELRFLTDAGGKRQCYRLVREETDRAVLYTVEDPEHALKNYLSHGGKTGEPLPRRDRMKWLPYVKEPPRPVMIAPLFRVKVRGVPPLPGGGDAVLGLDTVLGQQERTRP